MAQLSYIIARDAQFVNASFALLAQGVKIFCAVFTGDNPSRLPEVLGLFHMPHFVSFDCAGTTRSVLNSLFANAFRIINNILAWVVNTDCAAQLVVTDNDDFGLPVKADTPVGKRFFGILIDFMESFRFDCCLF